MKSIVLSVFVMLMSLNLMSQEGNDKVKRKFRAPIWTTHSKNTDILGVAFSLMPKQLFKDTTLTRTYGLRIEPSVAAILFPLIPKSPISSSIDEFEAVMEAHIVEKVNGVNLSSGTFGEVNINGLSACFFGQYVYRINGVGVSIVGNFVEKHNGLLVSGGYFGNQTFKFNGVAISFIGNESFDMNGLQIATQNYILNKGTGVQIGLYNQAKNFRGIQIGLWNKNDKRSLPIINWQFKG